MKEFTLNKKSWHYWLANFGTTRMGSYERKYGTDICHYIRSVIKGLFLFTIAMAICSALALWVGNAIYEIALYLIKGAELGEPTKFFIVFGGATVITLTILLTVYGAVTGTQTLMRKQRERRWEQGNPDEPGFLTLAYHKFKEKSCFKIKFEDAE